MSEEKHTPLPWKAEDDRVLMVNGLIVAECYGGNTDESCANAALIVRSVNAMPELVKALEEIIAAIATNIGGTQGAIRKRANDALAAIRNHP